MANDYTQLSRWLRSETMPHAEMLTKLRQRLERSLEPHTDEDGRLQPAETEPSGAPTRGWCRGYVAYQGGFRILVEEQRHRDQMVLAARLKSQVPMSEQEYHEGMAEMAADAIQIVSNENLVAELKRRGIEVST